MLLLLLLLLQFKLLLLLQLQFMLLLMLQLGLMGRDGLRRCLLGLRWRGKHFGRWFGLSCRGCYSCVGHRQGLWLSLCNLDVDISAEDIAECRCG